MSQKQVISEPIYILNPDGFLAGSNHSREEYVILQYFEEYTLGNNLKYENINIKKGDIWDHLNSTEISLRRTASKLRSAELKRITYNKADTYAKAKEYFDKILDKLVKNKDLLIKNIEASD